MWYDKFVLVPGDRLSETIGEGLARSRCGLAVISRAFFGKRWPSYELSGLMNRFIEEDMRLIPVWLDLSRKDVAEFNPALADLFSVRGKVDDINGCALEILRVVRPRLHENLKMLSAVGQARVRIERIPIGKVIAGGPIRHHDLPETLLVRIRNIWYTLRDVLPVSLEKTIENFQRDLQPEPEVCVWERIAAAFHIAMSRLETDEPDVRQAAFRIILQFSAGNHMEVLADREAGKIDKKVSFAAAYGCAHAVPDVSVVDVDEGDV